MPTFSNPVTTPFLLYDLADQIFSASIFRACSRMAAPFGGHYGLFAPVEYFQSQFILQFLHLHAERRLRDKTLAGGFAKCRQLSTATMYSSWVNVMLIDLIYEDIQTIDKNYWLSRRKLGSKPKTYEPKEINFRLGYTLL